jgi:hypothetical protein
VEAALPAIGTGSQLGEGTVGTRELIEEETVQPPDDELLEFDTSSLEDWDDERARDALSGDHGALYRNHLHIALHLDRWAKAESRRTDADANYKAGYVQALEDMAAFLRQTYYLPEAPD